MPFQPPIRSRSSTSLSVLHENSNALQTPCDHTSLVRPQRLRFLIRLLRPRFHHIPHIPRDRSAPFAIPMVHGPAAPARQDTGMAQQELRAQLADANEVRGAPWKCPVGPAVAVPDIPHTSHPHRHHHGCLGSNLFKEWQTTKFPAR